MEDLQWYVYTMFGVTIFIGFWLFLKAANFSKALLLLSIAWILVQSAASLSGFYSDSHLMTTRFPLLVFPPLVLIVITFSTKKGKAFIDGLDIRWLTIFHVIRIMVEVCLFWLFIANAVPRAMTFEGRNFDILSGITAPVVYYFFFEKKLISKWVLVAWNIACILLLLNVVSAAVLSLPGRFRHFGFEQPNIAVGYFPFILLPAFIVPLALFSNLAAIRQLLTKKV